MFMFKNTIDNKRYYTLNCYYKTHYGKKVFKVALNGGFTCPNKDGKKAVGGCIYCSPSGSGDFAGNIKDEILTQFKKIKEVELKKWPDALYIGYFQANSNTYGDINKLKELYETVLTEPNVVGLNIATRSDCFNKEIYDYLSDLNNRTDLVIELGLQSAKKSTIELINRHETKEEFENCIHELQKRNIKYVIHIINGLPGESKEDMIETAKYVNNLKPFGIKIHMLHIINNTQLANMFKKEPFLILSKDEYIDIVINQLEYLDENIIINRITGDPVREDLIEPTWLLKKFIVLNDVDKEMVKRDTYQGAKLKGTN